ncbi:MAG: HEPN domain-containing protein [candidate division KSB1 bacterium]|nr:HEPN domain-containing protein [candidate division KSB1 bacterium]
MAKDLSDLVRQWQVKAENDLLTIEQLMTFAPILTDSICFHAQQAAEKYSKQSLPMHRFSQ